MPKNVSLSAHIQAKANVGGALNVFPTKWDPKVPTTEEIFNTVLRELGRVTVAYNHLDQEVFDALSFLLAGSNPETADYAATVKATVEIRGFDRRLNIILSLFAARMRRIAERQKLDDILKACLAQHQKRNTFLHSRWTLPEKGSAAAAIRAKFHKSKDEYEDVTLAQLQKVVRDTEECTSRLNTSFQKVRLATTGTGELIA